MCCILLRLSRKIIEKIYYKVMFSYYFIQIIYAPGIGVWSLFNDISSNILLLIPQVPYLALQYCTYFAHYSVGRFIFQSCDILSYYSKHTHRSWNPVTHSLHIKYLFLLHSKSRIVYIFVRSTLLWLWNWVFFFNMYIVAFCFVRNIIRYVEPWYISFKFHVLYITSVNIIDFMNFWCKNQSKIF